MSGSISQQNITQGTPWSGPAPTPAYSGAASTSIFIPEIWSGKLI